MELISELVRNYGLLAVFVTMLLESALVPIPSELVVPLAGFLSSLGYFGLLEVVLVSSVANLVGSLIAYFSGARLRPYMPGFMLEHLEMSDRFFEKHGVKAVFIGRMLPAIRTFISLPAGLSKVPVWEFALLTFVGSVPWNAALAWGGYLLGENWELLHRYMFPISVGIVALVGLVLALKFKERFYKQASD